MRFISLAIIMSLLSQTALFAGGFEPGFDGIQYGYEPEIYEVRPSQYDNYGQHGQWTGQHQGQWEDYGQVWQYERPVIHQRRETQVWANINYCPSNMTNIHNQWALNGYREYDQWHQQGRRYGQNSGYWGYWGDQARYEHEREMTRMHYRYRDQEMNRIRKQREKEQRHQNRIVGFTALGMSIPFLINGFR